jgi:branched-chain amino acid aminotransferase
MSSTNIGRVVWFNGELVPESEARVSIYDSSLMFGDMVFEMTRSFNGVQFKLREHLERLYAGIKILRVPITMTMDEMERAVHEAIEANKPSFQDDDEHRILIDVSRGLLGLYQDVVGLHKGPNVIIADFPLRWTVVGMGRLFDGHINGVLVQQRALPGTLIDPKVKNRSRIHYLMANIEAGQVEGQDNWPILLDPDGFIAEGSGNNVFLVKNGKVYTPEGRNILRGISRGYVIEELCPQLGIEVFEKNLEPYDLYTADEAFVTSTPMCMLPVVRFNSTPIGDGRVGPVFTRILDRWSSNTGVDIPGQIKLWNSAHALKSDTPTPYRFKQKAS